MKCPNCSKEIRDGATFCGFCGKPVAQSSKAASAVPPARPVQRPAPPQPSAPQRRAPQQPMPRPPARKAPKKKRTGLIVTLCILAFLLVGGGAFGFLIYQGVIDVDIDSDSIFAFLRPEDDGRDEDDGDDRRSGRDRDEDDEDEDDRRKKDEDEDDDRREKDEDEDDDDRRKKDEDEDGRRKKDEDDDGRRESGKASAGASAEDTPTGEPDRPLISYWYADKAVCVVDQDQLWPDTSSKPFEGAAERLYWHADHSLLILTVDDAGRDIAAFTDNYLREFRDTNAYLGTLLNEIVVITFDRARLSCYMARYTDTAYVYDLDGLVQSVGSYISSGEYETAAVYLLKNAAEPEASDYLLPTSGTAYLTKNDLLGLTWEECCFARNEIYARHGRIFSTPAIRSYFESKSWYYGSIDGPTFDANVSNYLSATERANVNLIAEYERETWGGSFY